MWWKKRDKKKSTITIELPDKERRTRKIDVPKAKLDEWVKTGQAKLVYRVLVRGPWEGAREEHRTIDEEYLKFVGEDDTVYAICHYEKGQPQYAFVTKKFWDHYDEISAIMGDSASTQEQKALEVQKIIG